jgi:hypothetical protein
MENYQHPNHQQSVAMQEQYGTSVKNTGQMSEVGAMLLVVSSVAHS